MRLLLLTCVTMLLFAANSLLTRAGVAAGTEPMTFAMVRVAAGAVVLGVLALRARGHVPLRGVARGVAVCALVVYLVGFSMAYISLDAGVGALILFGVVQAGLFAGALAVSEPIGLRRWAGMLIALTALAWLLWPGPGAVVSGTGALWMILAGLGWALYTWQGRSEPWALGGTAGNFLIAAGAVALIWLAVGGAITASGLVAAIASGAIVSGLGYALWFHVLPQMRATTAGLAQLTVPVIALLAGAMFLGEAISLEAALACAGVLGGIALATVQRTRRSSGS